MLVAAADIEAGAIAHASKQARVVVEHRIPAAPVNDFAHALNDPQVRSRDMVVEVPLPNGQTVPQPGNPVKLSDTAEQHFTPPPTLGQHTDQVLGEMLGLTAKQLNELRKTGVIA